MTWEKVLELHDDDSGLFMDMAIFHMSCQNFPLVSMEDLCLLYFASRDDGDANGTGADTWIVAIDLFNFFWNHPLYVRNHPLHML